MGIRKFFRAYKTKWRFWLMDRRWARSARKKEIEVERNLPPRLLTPEEHGLLVWILEHGSEEARSFLPQVEGIRAVRSCTCGCPTIRLEVVENASLGSSQGRNIICDLLGRTEKGELVGLLLFQNGGKLSELEAYSLDSEFQGDLPEFGLPTVKSLSPFSVGEPPAAAQPRP